jgi:hypothetical protein
MVVWKRFVDAGIPRNLTRFIGKNHTFGHQEKPDQVDQVLRKHEIGIDDMSSVEDDNELLDDIIFEEGYSEYDWNTDADDEIILKFKKHIEVDNSGIDIWAESKIWESRNDELEDAIGKISKYEKCQIVSKESESDILAS